MKGFIRRAVATLSCAAAVAGAGGCYTYRDLVDPCYPQRYEYMARREVNSAFAPQVQNGHVLDQTVWNYFFEPGTARLTPGGLEQLAYLARRRPCPDPNFYLQTAQDVIFDPTNPEKMVVSRQELDAKRAQAVQQFLLAQTSGRGLDFQIRIHDPGEVGLPAIPVWMTTMRWYYTRFRGGLMTGGGGNVQGGMGGMGMGGMGMGGMGMGGMGGGGMGQGNLPGR